MKLGQILSEGPHDPHRQKAIFMIGTPGSGKTTIARRLISGTGLKMLSSDTVYEWLTMRDDNPIVGKGYDDELYQHSEKLVQRQLELWRENKLGLLIDATGRTADRLLELKSYLEKILGYETMAVFVKTDLNTALDRNDMRQRRVDPEWIRNTHTIIGRNAKKIQAVFGRNFVQVDNPDGASIDDIAPYKEVFAFLNRTPMTESIVDDEYGVRLREVVEIIRRRAQPWMSGYGFRHLQKPFFRGLATSSIDAVHVGKLGFIEEVRTKRKPLHSPQLLHEFFNEVIAEAGGKANRDNSIFIAADENVIKTYGRPYVIIPLGEYHYTWADGWTDWYARAENTIQDTPSKFLEDHLAEGSPEVDQLRSDLLRGIRIDYGLPTAHQQGAEVMVSCKEALYLDRQVWADIVQYYRDQLQSL